MTRQARVRTVVTRMGAGLPAAGAVLGFRAEPGRLGTYGHRIVSVDGRPARGLLLGLPVLGEQHARRTAELHRRIAGGPLPSSLLATAVWHGTLDLPGRAGVPAALAPDVYAEGYLPLHDAGGSLEAEPMRTRFALAHAIAAAAGDVARLGAVHGALDSSTILIRPADLSVRIIELESATFAPDEGHLPLASGAAAGYLAPELYDGTGEHPEAASGAADRWSLAVALHAVLTGYHPYHFLADLSPGTVEGYLGTHRWPAPPPGAAAHSLRYSTVVQALPGEVRDLFARVFQQGWRDGAARPAAAAWRTALGRWIGDPVVDELRADRDVVVRGESVTVSWRTRFAHRILLDGRDAGTAAGTATVPIDRPRAITLHAVGPFGVAEARTARIEVLRVPGLPFVEVRAPLSLHRAAARPGDGVFRAPVSPPVGALPAIPAPDRPSPPDPAVARLPPATPRLTGALFPHLGRAALRYWRTRNTGHSRAAERHNR